MLIELNGVDSQTPGASSRESVTTFEFDPLVDTRWSAFLGRHPRATVFHTREWLDALRRTYGYRPVAVTTCPPDTELTNAVVFCRVKSWLTGRRLVSNPFSDHCAPLVDSTEQLAGLLSHLQAGGKRRRGKYIEMRTIDGLPGLPGFSEFDRYHLHRLDLRPTLDELYSRLHASCIRRKISRAMREDFVHREGRSDEILEPFHRLAVLTRRRHHLPAQPLSWFRNLIHCLGEKLNIRMLFHKGKPVTGILTLRFRNTMTYKYGVSDPESHPLGGMQLLLWRAIEEARHAGLEEFDMGRSRWNNEGLIAFKDRWGCFRSSIVYLRSPEMHVQSDRAARDVKLRIARRIFALAPDRVLTTAGNLLYRHIA